MRSADFGVIPGISKQFSKEETLEMFRHICNARAFESRVKKVNDEGKLIKMPIYLGLGQESIAAALALSFKNPAIFAQHRAHDLYLSYGGDVAALIDELLHQPTGCARGMGGSASIHSPAIKMYGHSGLMGDQIPIAVGFALGKKEKTLAVMGDASAEEDYVLGALGYASTKKLPILFVCVDNNVSISTKIKIRRNWLMPDVAKAFKLKAVEITDDPWLIMHHVAELQGELPAFINIHTCRALSHAAGSVDVPDWNRFALVKEEMARLNLREEGERIEATSEKNINTLWDERIKAIKIKV